MVSVAYEPAYKVSTDPTQTGRAASGGDTLGRWYAAAGETRVFGSVGASVGSTAVSGEGAERPSEPAGTGHQWLAPTYQALTGLLQLREGWNSYRAHPIAPDSTLRALTLLAATMLPDTPAPSVLPTPPGGVQLEWHMRGIDLEVEIAPRGDVSMFYEDEVTGATAEQVVTTEHRPLRELLIVLTRRPD